MEEDYVVDKILDKRVRNGEIEYYLSWKGYTLEESTWEPKDNLDCFSLIKAYEDQIKTKKPRDKTSKKSSSAPSAAEKEKPSKIDDLLENRPRGFSRGLKASRIVGATDSSGELMFLMKWEGSSEADLVPAKQANVKAPQVVIRYYEERLSWATLQKGEEEEEQES